MKILIHIKKLEVESTLTFILNDILHLKEKADIKILCSDSSCPPANLEKYIIRYPYSEKRILLKFQYFLAIHNILIYFKTNKHGKLFREVVQEFKPDLVMAHFGDESLFFLQNVETKVPILVFFHGYDASAWLRVKKYVSTYKRLISKRNIIPVTCSEDMRNRMQQAGIPMDKALVLYYGIDTNFFARERSKRNNPPVFLQVSSFHEKKGHTYTIKAFKKLVDQFPDFKFKLILAGEGNLKNTCIELVEQLQLKNYVSFPGWVSREQTRLLMEDADYFVHHSITDRFGNMEGVPNAIIEAMAMELPVISTSHSGIPELVTHLKNGILIQEKDVPEYAEAIQKILNFPYLKENRMKVESAFNITKRVENLYQKIQDIVNETH